jgi:hypothetical protein
LILQLQRQLYTIPAAAERLSDHQNSDGNLKYVIAHIRMEIENGGLEDDIDFMLSRKLLSLSHIQENSELFETLIYNSSTGILGFMTKSDAPLAKLLTAKSGAGDILEFIVFQDFTLLFLRNGILVASLKNPFDLADQKNAKKGFGSFDTASDSRSISVYGYAIARGPSCAIRLYDVLKLKSDIE